jgi:hypothetical protein
MKGPLRGCIRLWAKYVEVHENCDVLNLIEGRDGQRIYIDWVMTDAGR